MSELSVTADFSKAIDFFKDARKQVLYAEAQACNATAIDVQKFTVGRLLPEKFVLRARGNPWQRPGTKYGFNVKFASSKSETIQSVVGSQADWLNLQETGGVKSRSGKNLAIVADAREEKTAVLKAKDKPRRLLQNVGDKIKGRLAKTEGAGFKLNLKKGGQGIFIRKSPTELRLMYALKPTAQIKPVLQYVVHGKRIVDERFEPNFNAAFLKVLPEALHQ